jgi:hypothetical protein
LLVLCQAANQRTSELVGSLTQNLDLRTVFTYSWGDYGTPPSQSHFGMQVRNPNQIKIKIFIFLFIAIRNARTRIYDAL